MFPSQKRPLYTNLLTMSEDFTEYPQKLLSGLGKSTKRGIKKCPRCGTFNGTRSTVCKNKNCNVVNVDAVKLLTNTEKQLYSVKIWDMGPNYRAFVQLPLLQSSSNEDPHVYSDVALCFVDSCKNSFDNSILKCHEEGTDSNSKKLLFCTHIRSALKSQSKASPMELKPSVLTSLNVTDDIKEKLCSFNSEKEGVFVQRVSKSVMAVKCQASAKHPLGYLHFTFIKGKGRDVYEKFYCSCSEFSVSELSGEGFESVKYKCIHYYACIWALASDQKLSEEFTNILRNEFSFVGSNNNTTQNIKSRDNAVPNDSTKVTEKVDSNRSTDPNNDFNVTDSKSKDKVLVTDSNKITQNDKCRHKHAVNLVNRKNGSKIVKKNLILHRKKETLKQCQKIMPKILPIEIKVLEETPKSNDVVSWGFVDWLSFVTESINRTMQFENYGMVNTTILQIPEDFYNYFAKRIPSIYEVVQTGNSSAYYIMNILHLKEIFDTPKIKLKISKKFVHNDEKGYVEFDENDDNEDESFLCPFIYFINVGQSTVDESDNTNNYFYVEWTPSVFSVTNIGQLRFQYKYGRKST
ncbi:uncharacterized protein C2orf42 isoform X1 [Diabrotica virgifera virgifera]|uniref:Uncharacterized protein C2orf42 isoform X1 n=1 Tax=Diabrotica virgifera virgifera TaxID=50390 RepID=A0A6P7F6N6_DIAVI|nr:uncharacterized protein C2orf42 isoform X1 [Diabrotica virgifera virgifera]